MRDRLNQFLSLILHNILWIVNGFLLVYAGLPVLAPILMFLGFTDVAQLIYLVYRFFCHQKPSHSLFIFGHQMAYCARDTAIYSTLLLTSLWVSVWPLKKTYVGIKTLILMSLPMALDGTLAFIFEILSHLTRSDPLYKSTTDMRILTGWLFGLGIGLFLFTRLKESVKNLDLEE